MWMYRKDLLLEDHGIIVHGVNAQGKFNSGFAKQVRQRYPQVYADYMAAYAAGHLQLGRVIYTPITPHLVVASGVTQHFYGRDPDVVYADYTAIARVFTDVRYKALDARLPVKFPEVGCGLANGDWRQVKLIIEAALGEDVLGILYRPQ